MNTATNADLGLKAALWLVLLTAASVLTTLALACATPFSALGALTALHLRRADGIVLTATVWLSSQVIGFGLLHYPHTVKTYIWGAALLICALACMAGATAAVSRMRQASPVARGLGALLVAMIVFKAMIFLFGIGLGGNEGAFSAHVLARFVVTNAIAFAGLLLLHRAALALGLAARVAPPAALATR
jgi:hypothetical protein